MMDVTMIYSEERGTWNIILNGCEWYYEGTYEECVEVMDGMMIDNTEEFEEVDEVW